MYDLYMVIC
jgi:hypothetical protein